MAKAIGGIYFYFVESFDRHDVMSIRIMSSTPLVSVIIPCFNHGKYLRTAIESASTCQGDVEILVIDDGSTDNTGEIALGFESRVRYIRQENAGLSASRNRGILESRGKWLHFLDADDWVSDNFYERHLAAAQQLISPAVLVSGVKYATDANNIWLAWEPRIVEPMYSALLAENIVGAVHSALVPRSALPRVGLFDSNLPACEDWDFWLRMARARVPFVPVSGAYAIYRQVPGSMSRNLDRMVTGASNMFAKQVSYLKSPAERRTITRAQRRYIRRLSMPFIFDEMHQVRNSAGILPAAEVVMRALFKRPALLLAVLYRFGQVVGRRIGISG